MTDLTESELETYKWLVRSQKRIQRLKELDKPNTISALAEEFSVKTETMQEQVKDLRDKDLVKPLNPEDNKGILYTQTNKAEKILEKVEG